MSLISSFQVTDPTVISVRPRHRPASPRMRTVTATATALALPAHSTSGTNLAASVSGPIADACGEAKEALKREKKLKKKLQNEVRLYLRSHTPYAGNPS
jgi:hypothetical protein